MSGSGPIFRVRRCSRDGRDDLADDRLSGPMTNGTTSLAQELGPRGLALPLKGRPRRASLTRRLELAVLVLGGVSAVAAVWITLTASFLEYPGWLAAQKADFILGPIGVGLYWRHRRPANRLWVLLVLLGLCGILYIAESSTNPTLFGIGVLAETPIYVVTALLILAFPSGGFDAIASGSSPSSSCPAF